MVYSQSWDSIYRQHLIFLWGCHNLKSFQATGCLHWCHFTPLCPYMGRMHIWQTMFCASPLADLNENQLMWKACYLEMTSSFPINLSLSCCLFLRLAVLWFFYSPSHSSCKGTVTFVNFHHCKLMHSSTKSMCFSHDLISCYDSHRTQQAEENEKVTWVLLSFWTPPPFFPNFSFIQVDFSCSPRWTVPPGLPQRCFAEHSERACWALTERPWDLGGVY